jgi:FkbM family methyltransferase
MDIKVAVVTPYHREEDSVLRDCLASVKGQTWKQCTHFLVADGVPNPLIANAEVKHIVLPSAHGPGGNLARCIGALTAVAEGFDAVAFLDADNWYRPEHIARMVELHLQTGASVCSSGRSIHRPDGSPMPIDDQNAEDGFIDTSCLCVFRAGFDLLPLWGMMPVEFGPICDRVMSSAIKTRRVPRAHVPEPTVCFRTQYAGHYKRLGETPPPGAKESESAIRIHEQFKALPLVEMMALMLGLATGEDPRASTRSRDSQVAMSRYQVGNKDRKFVVEAPDNGRFRLAVEDILTKEAYAIPIGVPPVKNILDIGAGVGLSAAYFRLVFPDAALYCVEPDPFAYDLLGRNAANIGNCLTYRAALYAMTAPSSIYLDDSGFGSTLAPVSERPMRVLLLDAWQFIASLPVSSFDLVKLDTAGAEVPILLRIRECIKQTGVIQVRFHSRGDRQLIDEILRETHELWRGALASPDLGRLTYVRRRPVESASAGA